MIIKIKNLLAYTLLGAYPEERHEQRPVIINIEFDYDHTQAVASDKLDDALDYAAIEEAIVGSVSEQTFVLLESLAKYIAELIMGFAVVRSVMVEVDKPDALRHADSVSATYSLARR